MSRASRIVLHAVHRPNHREMKHRQITGRQCRVPQLVHTLVGPHGLQNYGLQGHNNTPSQTSILQGPAQSCNGDNSY